MTKSTTRSDEADDASPKGGSDYLTEKQFCNRYHVSPRTAQRWAGNRRWSALCASNRSDPVLRAIA
jgi:hypothetical protein